MKWKLEEDITRLGADEWIKKQLLKARNNKESQNNVKIVNALEKALLRIAPECGAELIDGMAVDLGDLVKVGSKHKRHVNNILKLTGPEAPEKLLEILVEIELNLLFEGMFHLRSLKKNLPKLRSAANAASRRNKTKEKPSKRAKSN